MNFKEMTTIEIKRYLACVEPDEALLVALREDTRRTVRQLARGVALALKDRRRVQAMYRYERAFFGDEDVLVGMDEAGRGPLAGPVVVAAVLLPQNLYIPHLNDSKKLSAKAREKIYTYIVKNAIEVQRTFINEGRIDEVNIYQATIEGMYRTLRAFSHKLQGVLTDAVPLPELNIPHRSIVRGDAKSCSIAAASVVAKVERDRYMEKMDRLYPQYGFAQHKGYGTKKHVEALRLYGPCEIHRKTFEPVRSL